MYILDICICRGGSSWGHAPPENFFLKWLLKYFNLKTFPLKITPVDIIYTATACVNGKVLVGSHNHMIATYSHNQWKF